MAHRYHVEIVAPDAQSSAVDDALIVLARQGIYVHIERENYTNDGAEVKSSGTYNKFLHGAYFIATRGANYTEKAGE